MTGEAKIYNCSGELRLAKFQLAELRNPFRNKRTHCSIESKNCLTANAATLRSVKVATPLCAAKEAIPCGLAVSRLEVCVENNPPYDCRHTEDFLFYEHRTMRGFPSCRRAGAGCPFSPGILAEGRRGRGFHPWPPARSGRRRLGSRPRVHRRSGGSIRSSAPRAWAGAPQSCAP